MFWCCSLEPSHPRLLPQSLKDCPIHLCLFFCFAIILELICHPVIPVVMYGCESWTIKKAKCWRIDSSELQCWRRLLRVPWTARGSSHSILKEISPEYSLEGLMLKLKLQSIGHWLIWEDPDAGKDWRQEVKGKTEDEMVRLHHWLNEFESTLGVGDGQGGLACCSPWGCKEWDTTEQLNWTELKRYCV